MEAWVAGRGWIAIDLLSWVLSAGGEDPEWRKMFVGSLDYRMKTQVFPDTFTGSPGVPIPTAWRLLERATAQGIRTTNVSAADGTPVCTDEVEIVNGD